MSAFVIFALCSFVSGFATRLSDPIVLPISRFFVIDPATAAMFSVAFALPYAAAQPFLGPLGDRFGKDRCIQICIVIMAVALAAGAVAPTFPILIGTRIVAGLAAAGLIPLVLASLGDRFALAERQVMIGRMLFAIITGQMLGSAVSGLANDAWGWRSPLIIAAVMGAVVAVVAVLAFKAAPRASAAARAAAPSVRAVYATIFQNPKSIWLYGAVTAEGILFFGPFPYIGQLLVDHTGAEGSAIGRETGLVLGAVGIGGLAYAMSVRLMMAKLGSARMSIVGTIVTALCFSALSVATSWWVCALVMGIGGTSFFMLHSSMQTYATELSPSARASSVALFACGFFAGQGLGPLCFGPLYRAVGFTPALVGTAVAFIVLGRVVVGKVMR